MVGTERDDKGFLPLLPSPCTTPSSPHLLSKNATEMLDKTQGKEEVLDETRGGEEKVDNTRGGEGNITRGGEGNITRGGEENDTPGGEENDTREREELSPPTKQLTAVATTMVSASEPPDHDEVSARESGVIDSNNSSKEDTRVWKDSQQSGDGDTQVLKNETRQGLAVEVAIESIRSCRGKGEEISGEPLVKGGVIGVPPDVPGESAVDVSGGEESGQRPDVGQGTSGEDTSGDGASGGSSRHRNNRRACGGCVVG